MRRVMPIVSGAPRASWRLAH